MHRISVLVFSIGVMLPVWWLYWFLSRPDQVLTENLIAAAFEETELLTSIFPFNQNGCQADHTLGGGCLSRINQHLTTYLDLLTKAYEVPQENTSSLVCNDCPEIKALMVNPCTFGFTETEDEFMLIWSGCGFNVDDLIVDIANPGGSNNTDIGGGNNCQFALDNSALVSDIQTASGFACLDGTNIFSAGPGDYIPAGSLVLVFMDLNSTSIDYDFSGLCFTGYTLYILKNDCDRGTAAFLNTPPQTYGFSTPLCSDNVTYTSLATGSVGVNNVIVFEDGSSMTTTSCIDPGLSFVSYPLPSCPVVSSFVAGDNNCAGDSTGNIVTNPLGLYTYDWDWDGTPLVNDVFDELPMDGLDDESIYNLYSGIYTVTVTDPGSGCTSVYTVTIVEPEPISLSYATVDSVSCYGGANGIIDVGATGGYSGITFNYNWDFAGTSGVDDDYGTPPAESDPNNITNLQAGIYYLTVSDANYPSCRYLDTFVVFQPALLTVSVMNDTLDCYGFNNGALTAIPTGGTTPYTYNWSTISGIDEQMETGLGPGPYPVTVTDTNGCTSTAVAIVTQPTQLTAMAVGDTVSCWGDSNGNIGLTVSGGTIPYLFDWDNNGTGDNDDPEDLSGLTAGTYSVIVTDFNGCIVTASATITQPPFITKSVFDDFCAGDSVLVYGVWYSTPGMFADTLINVMGGCDTALMITITRIPLLTNAVSDSYCYGDSVQVYGVWYSSIGTYADTVQSTTGGCDTTLTITITEEPLILKPVSGSYCYGDSVQVYGVWYSSVGTYADTVHSTTGGCDTALIITITEDPLIPKPVSDSYCYGDSVQVYGVWHSSIGTYADTVQSATGGCDTALTITITEDPLIPKSVSDSYCYGDSIQVYGVGYSSIGTYADTVQSTTGGCDTALTITITEDPLIPKPVSGSYCDGDSVQVYGVWYSSVGTNADTVQSTTGGCDTALTITI